MNANTSQNLSASNLYNSIDKNLDAVSTKISNYKMYVSITTKIIFFLLSFYIFFMGILITIFLTDSSKTEAQRNANIKGYNIWLIVSGVVSIVIIAILFAMKQLQINNELTWIFIITSIILLSVGSYMTSLANDSSVSSETLNLDYIKLSVSLCAIGGFGMGSIL